MSASVSHDQNPDQDNVQDPVTPAGSFPVVDSHLHVWVEDRETYPRADTPHRASPELLLDYMDEAGVDYSVIVLPQHYKYDNRVLADTMRQYPDRFAGVGVVDPRGQRAADALERLWREHGVRGVRLRATIEEEWFGHEETAPLWRRVGELGLPLCLLGRPKHVSIMRAWVERFPETGPTGPTSCSAAATSAT